MSWTKKIAGGGAYAVFLIICVAVLLEVVFRVLPTTSPVDLQAVTSTQEILRFKSGQAAVFSLGSNFYKTVKKRTNNAGFYSNFDYEKEKSPKIVIIGDSYVEAAQIESSDTVGELMMAEKKQAVYQMGVSGIPLSQYIKMVEYAKKNYSPSRFAIVIVGNDFDQSLCDHRIKLGTWCFDDKFELVFKPFAGYEGVRSYARKSAFLRYLVFQAGISWRQLLSIIGMKIQGVDADSEYAGNVERFKDRAITNKSFVVIDRFFEELNNLNVIDKVTLVLDADRQDIYNNKESESYFQEMREYTISKAEANRVTLIDMREIFETDYKSNGIKFEFPTDGHWNERAHKLLAEALTNN